MEGKVIPPSLKEMEATRARLDGLLVETPVLAGGSSRLRAALGDKTDVFYKLELFQHGGSFKPRGALNVMLSMTKDEQAQGVTSVSAGNHAIAVGYAARTLGIDAKLVMPKTAPAIRVARCREYGAEVVIVEDVHAAFKTAHALEREEGRYFVHPFDGPHIALGTATLALEFVRQQPKLEAVIVPIGGGGLCAGVATAIKTLLPQAKVYGVEPTGADTMSRSFAAGKPMAIERVDTIADSLGAPHAASYSYELCRRFVDEIVLLEDDALCRALALLFHEAKLAVEPAGAAATAALWGPLRHTLAGKQVGVIVCGTNTDADTFMQQLRRGEALL